MSLERILKLEFLRNLFMRTQEQVENLAEFIYAIKRTSTSSCFSIISVFVKRLFRNRNMKQMRNR